MTITTGDKLPQGQLLRVGESGPESLSTDSMMQGRGDGKGAQSFAFP